MGRDEHRGEDHNDLDMTKKSTGCLYVGMGRIIYEVLLTLRAVSSFVVSLLSATSSLTSVTTVAGLTAGVILRRRRSTDGGRCFLPVCLGVNSLTLRFGTTNVVLVSDWDMFESVDSCTADTGSSSMVAELGVNTSVCGTTVLSPFAAERLRRTNHSETPRATNATQSAMNATVLPSNRFVINSNIVL